MIEIKGDIPPVGRERDIFIAQVKKIKPEFACYVDDISGDNYCVLDDGMISTCGVCKQENIADKTQCKHWKLRPEWPDPYSTELYFVWELWEELPEIKTITFRHGKYFLQYGVSDNPADLLYHPGVEGDNFEDVVSMAWIKWGKGLL